MRPLVLFTVVATLLVVILLTRFVIAYAKRGQLLDIPNRRSSHSEPTPRGGGLAVVLGSTAALAVLALLALVDRDAAIVTISGGLLVAAIGLVDDYSRVAPSIRLAIHLTAAVWAVVWLGGMPPLQWGEHTYDLGVVGSALAVAAIVWSINLFNFMDGIDGIAASEAMFVCLAGAGLGLAAGGPVEVAPMALVLGAASAGFLVWNWPPAKVFMGDVGSGYLGFAIAILALTAGAESPAGPLVWLILGAVFVVDATVTLIRRFLRRERVHEAHRTHAYQWLARGWHGHQRVTVSVLAIDVVWLLPIAWYATRHPRQAGWCVALAFVPLVVVALLAGAGRSEGELPSH